jgi:4a-hydroxytetrahydrobiopterin dehydratase
MEEIPNWTLETNDQAIVRNYHFPGFDQAISFVYDVVEVSQKASHYPSIDIRFNQVKLRLTTPAADGLTDTDFDLAVMFDHLAEAILALE